MLRAGCPTIRPLINIKSVEELTGGSFDDGLKPGKLFRDCGTKPSPRPSPKGRGQNCTTSDRKDLRANYQINKILSESCFNCLRFALRLALTGRAQSPVLHLSPIPVPPQLTPMPPQRG
jgi:hypothetical protein